MYHGAKAVYFSGYSFAIGHLGTTDMDLYTGPEIADGARRTVSALRKFQLTMALGDPEKQVAPRHLAIPPVVVDMDGGYGNLFNVQRTAELYVNAGLAGAHLEDQVLPKRCGHIAGKALISADEMVGKLRMAKAVAADLGRPDFVVIARTDAVSAVDAPEPTRGLDLAIAREWLIHRWGGHPDELSAAGVADAMRAPAAGAGELVVLEGYDRLPALLASGLDVRLGRVVRRIRWSEGSVEVEVGDEAMTARATVVTVPPPAVVERRLAFEPALPSARMAAARAIDLGDAVVLCASTSEPAPWSAWALVVGEYGGLWHVQAGSRLVTASFRNRAAAAVRRTGIDPQLVERLIAPVLPWIASETIGRLHVADWGGDPFSLGAYSYPRVGFLDAPRGWAAPLGSTVFFAGEATSVEGYRGLVDGAIESGRRAAQEVLASRSSR